MTAIKAVLLLLLGSGLAVPAPAPTDEALEGMPDIPGLQRQVEQLRAQYIQVAGRLGELMGIHKVKKVAFSVSFKSEADNHIGPFSTDTTLIFDHIFINHHNAYNSSSGVFTAPVRGVYQFNYHIFAGGDHGAGAKLLKNGEQIVAAYNHKAPHDINTSQSVSLVLERGDTVSLLLEAGWWVSAYRGHLTTFSGKIINPLYVPQV